MIQTNMLAMIFKRHDRRTSWTLMDALARPGAALVATVAVAIGLTVGSACSRAEVAFFEEFRDANSLKRFTWGVFHRNAGWQIKGQPLNSTGWLNAQHGGSWSADHDRNCGPIDTHREFTSTKLAGASFDFRLDDLLYVCHEHLMTTMGDVDGYSVVWFSPNKVFSSVADVSFDVSLADLGTRQWFQVGVVSEKVYNQQATAGVLMGNTAPAHLRAVDSASTLNRNLSDGDVLIATWGGGSAAGYAGKLRIGNGHQRRAFANPTPKSKVDRHPVRLVDNNNGTVSFSVAGVTLVDVASFPSCPCRVVFYDHSYNPDKSERGQPIGYTWHWDNIRIRARTE